MVAGSRRFGRERRPVRPQETHELALRHLEVDACERLDPAVSFTERADGKSALHGGESTVAVLGTGTMGSSGAIPRFVSLDVVAVLPEDPADDAERRDWHDDREQDDEARRVHGGSSLWP